MNYKRIGRALVCLVLVACLVVNISPVKAKASATATAAIVGMSAVTVAGSLMLGLVVLPGSDVNVFNGIANTIATNLTASGWVTDGMIDVYKLNDAAYTFGVPQGIIDETRSFLWQNNYILSGFDFPDELINPSAFEIALSYCEQFSLCVFWVQSDGSYRFVGGSSFDIEPWSSGGFTIRHTSGIQYRYWDVTSTTGTPAKKSTNSTYIIPNSYQVYRDGVWGSITVADGLASGEIAPQSASFADGYSTWAGNATTIPGTAGDGSDDIIVVPAGNLALDDVTTQSQEDIWNGALVEDDETEDIPAVPPVEGLTGSLSDTKAETFLDGIVSAFSGLFEKLISTGELIVEKIEALPAAFASWLEKILEWLAKIWEAIKAIPGLIAEAFADVLALAFVPAEGYLDAEVTSLCAQYPLADSCMNLITSFHDAFSGLGGEPPVIYIHLEDYEGSYNIGGTVPILDMRWYARYKPTVDTLLSSLLWIFFIWRVLVHAPSIISGVAGDVEAFNSGPSGGYFSADNPYRGQFERPARGRFESRRNRK